MVSWPLCLFLGIFSSCWVPMSKFNMVIFPSSYYLLYLHLLYFTLSHLCVASNERQKGGGTERRGGMREELKGIEGGKIIFRIDCMRKECIFNTRENVFFFLPSEALCFEQYISIAILFVTKLEETIFSILSWCSGSK